MRVGLKAVRTKLLLYEERCSPNDFQTNSFAEGLRNFKYQNELVSLGALDEIDSLGSKGYDVAADWLTMRRASDIGGSFEFMELHVIYGAVIPDGCLSVACLSAVWTYLINRSS